MAEKVSLIHVRLEDLPANHQKLILRANEDAATEKALRDERNKIETTLKAQDSPHFDEAKVRSDFSARLEIAIKELRIPRKALLLTICRSESDKERSWNEIKELVAQIVLWIRTRQAAQRNRKKAECRLVRNPIAELSKMEQASNKMLLEESYWETAKLLGYQSGDYHAIMQVIDRQMQAEARMRK